MALEDAETGEIVELDTGRASVRERFKQFSRERGRLLKNDFRAEGIDTLQLQTGTPYIPALQRFFKTRGRARV